jgi:hypothetical protein
VPMMFICTLKFVTFAVFEDTAIVGSVLAIKKMSVNKEFARAFDKMLPDISCIFGKLCKRRRRRRLAAKFWNKLVLSCIYFLGLEIFAECGSERRYSGLLRLATAGNGSKRVNLLLPKST